MSTVDKNTADRIIAGEFPEDNCVAILRYENAFDGNFAYKLIFARGLWTSESIAREIAGTVIRINTGAPVKVYWTDPRMKLKEKLLEMEYATEEDFLSYN